MCFHRTVVTACFFLSRNSGSARRFLCQAATREVRTFSQNGKVREKLSERSKKRSRQRVRIFFQSGWKNVDSVRCGLRHCSRKQKRARKLWKNEIKTQKRK